MVEPLVNSEHNARRIAEVESCFDMSGESLAIPGRVLVGDGVLFKMCRKKTKPRQVFLFNDILVYGSIIIPKKKYFRQHIIPLEDVNLENLEDKGELRNGWVIKTPKKTLVFYAPDAFGKKDWMRYINNCVEELFLRTGSRPAEEHAAVCVTDNATEECMLCKTKFTVINRRCNCCNCGLVVCEVCSRNRFLITSLSSEPIRSLSEDPVKNNQETTNTIGTTPPVTCTETKTFNEQAVDVEVTKKSVDDNSNKSSDSNIKKMDYNGKTLRKINESLKNLEIGDDVKPTYRGIDRDKVLKLVRHFELGPDRSIPKPRPKPRHLHEGI